MQIKNKIILIIICTLCLSIFNSNLNAEEFNISALEFSIDQKNNIDVGEGEVEVIDSEGNNFSIFIDYFCIFKFPI